MGNYVQFDPKNNIFFGIFWIAIILIYVCFFIILFKFFGFFGLLPLFKDMSWVKSVLQQAVFFARLKFLLVRKKKKKKKKIMYNLTLKIVYFLGFFRLQLF